MFHPLLNCLAISDSSRNAKVIAKKGVLRDESQVRAQKDATCILLLFQAGTVWCNCWLVRDLNMPFGGFKASGIGREGAKESYEFYTEVKTVCIKM